MRKVQLLLSAMLLGLMMAACAPKATPAPATQAPASAPAATTAQSPVPAAPSKPAWQEKWEQTLALAKKEGSVVLYVSLGGQQRQAITDAFTSKYGVRVESVTGGSSNLAQKVLTEQRAGIYSEDVWISGSTSFVPLKGAIDSLDQVLILPELTDTELIKKTWYFGEVPWADKAHTMLIGLMDFKQFISTNTNLVKPGEITSYRDLLDPKWKGKISLNDPRVRGNGNMWFSVALEMGDMDVNYMRELATKQELFFTTDWRLQVEWLARGKHAIAIGPNPATVTEFMELGTPVNRISLGTPAVSGATSGIAMLKRAPHPNAAKLFINWLLSQEGSTFLSQAVGAQAQRLDVSTAHLDPAKVLKPGLKIYNADNEDFANKKDTSYITLAKEVFSP